MLREAGFNAIEVHGGHVLLIAEFLSAYTNNHTDYFRGKFENKMRFPFKIVKDVRRYIGSRIPITFRFSSDEMVPGDYQ